MYNIRRILGCSFASFCVLKYDAKSRAKILHASVAAFIVLPWQSVQSRGVSRTNKLSKVGLESALLQK